MLRLQNRWRRWVSILRVPFTAIDGELDVPGVIVRLGTPYILSHVYQDELDDNVNTLTAGTSGMDRFAEPKDQMECEKKIYQYWESAHARIRASFY